MLAHVRPDFAERYAAGPDIVAAGGLPHRQREPADQQTGETDDEEDDLPGPHRPDERQVDLFEVLQHGEHGGREPGADRGAGEPVMKTAMAVPLRSGGKRSEIMDMAAGPRVASPAPTPIRPRNSVQKDRARPQAAVARLQTVMPAAMMRRRDRASTSRPMGMPKTE